MTLLLELISQIFDNLHYSLKQSIISSLNDDIDCNSDEISCQLYNKIHTCYNSCCF